VPKARVGDHAAPGRARECLREVGWTLDAEAAALTAPTLLIQGSEDPYGTLEQLERIETRARGPVDRLVLAGGHSPHVEHPAEVAGAIAAFSRTLTSLAVNEVGCGAAGDGPEAPKRPANRYHRERPDMARDS
jgi:pimeloyl-ACP methyl ester carboxylesterase